MASSLKYLNSSTRYAEFFIDSISDLQTLPTTKSAGTETLSTVTGVSQGSRAILTTTDDYYYRLKGNDTWAKITAAGGGGGGGDATPLTQDEMDALTNAINNGTGGD